MKDIFIKWFMAINAFLIRVSGGKVGSRLGTQTILVLHTVGRKSGVERATPIAYFDYQDTFLVVASNWGKDKQADWLLNLRKAPQASVDVKGKTYPVRARETQGEEYKNLWKFATEKHPPYLEYQKMTERTIPIVVLEKVK